MPRCESSSQEINGQVSSRLPRTVKPLKIILHVRQRFNRRLAGMDRSLSQKRLLHRIMGIFKTAGTAAVEIESGEHFYFLENHCGASARRNDVVESLYAQKPPVSRILAGPKSVWLGSPDKHGLPDMNLASTHLRTCGYRRDRNGKTFYVPRGNSRV